MNARSRLLGTLAVITLALASIAATAQQPAAPPPATSPETSPQASGARPFDANAIRAWSLITEAAAPGRSTHDRIEAVAALGTMGSDERAAHLIADAINGHESDVRVAAILAAGLSKNPKLIPPLQTALNDDNAQVAYTAAITLWKMHDTSGEDLLIAVALGDRKPNPGFIKIEKHKADRELHDPKSMAVLAVANGSGYFLGPFGVGVKAIEYVGKNKATAIARSSAIDQLAQQHTQEVHDALVQDLTDGEPAVRAAAAKALGRWPGEDTARLVAPMFGDNRLAVRLTAAATYLRATENIPTPPDNDCGTE
ncbi:MAG TPA: HEAT repeat domain-containing protein [Acidobacteriaceae bacterium]|jgi:HEAT repeat protein|nr:HEAT repeat domain-containing protein [Acidobacteriaceae bacterium]